jgi:hypothetical protein
MSISVTTNLKDNYNVAYLDSLNAIEFKNKSFTQKYTPVPGIYMWLNQTNHRCYVYYQYIF